MFPGGVACASLAGTDAAAGESQSPDATQPASGPTVRAEEAGDAATEAVIWILAIECG